MALLAVLNLLPLHSIVSSDQSSSHVLKTDVNGVLVYIAPSLSLYSCHPNCAECCLSLFVLVQCQSFLARSRDSIDTY